MESSLESSSVSQLSDENLVFAALAARTDISPEERPRILVIDANLLTAEAIVLALAQGPFSARFMIPITMDHLRDLVTWRPGLVLLDIDSVERDLCLGVITLLHEACVPVAIVGGRNDVQLLGECVHAGVASAIDKSVPLTELIGTAHRILDGEAVMSDAVRQQVMEPYHQINRARRTRLAPFEVLTQREKFVLAELMEGRGAEAIARSACVSLSTVRSQIKAILQKLGVNSQLAAAAMARQASWSL